MGLTVIEWAASFITILTPIWGTILWYIPIKSKWMYLISSVAVYFPTVIMTFNPLKLKGVTQWLHWYGLFFIIYMAAFGVKLKWTDWNKAATMALFALFIGGELWELPIFAYDYLGKVGILHNYWTDSILNEIWIFSHIRRIYTLAACYLLSTLAKIRMTRMGWIFLASGIGFCMILLLPIGLGIRIGFTFVLEMAHITSLSFTGIIIMEGMDAP